MRFLDLSPPRRIAALSVDAEERSLTAVATTGGRWNRSGQGGGSTMNLRSLDAPETTDFPPRHLLDPKDGWFRRTERGINRFLSRRVFPHVPLMRVPYTRLLERTLTVSTARIALRGLAAERNIRVLVISDIHAGPFIGPEALRRTFERLMTTEPELILLPGDFATVLVDEVAEVVPALRSLRAPLGVFGVLGNHDHYTGDVSRVSDLLEQGGVRLLQNDSVVIEKDGGQMLLAGVDDLLHGEPRLDDALVHARDGLPTVLMSHNPDIFPQAVERGVSLVLSGHTHGGQVRVPGLPVLVRMSRFFLDEGRYQVGDSELVVTRGLGVTGLPLRLGCPPEALLLDLVAA